MASTKTMAIAVMKVFMAGLRWCLTSAASNNVNLGARAEIQREAPHTHGDSWVPGRPSPNEKLVRRVTRFPHSPDRDRLARSRAGDG